MKNIFKKAFSLILALALVSGALTSAAASGADFRDLHPMDEEHLSEIAAQAEELADLFSRVFDVEIRMVTLTEEAMAIALSDFEYLANKILQTAPTLNILYRRLGVNAELFFAVYHQIIYNNIPLPSIIALDMGERWADIPDEARYIAADYLYILLTMMSWELQGLGHMGVQPLVLIEQVFFGQAYRLQAGADTVVLDPDDIDRILDLGFAEQDIERAIRAAMRFAELHVEIFNTPSVLWFYGIDPDEFDFDVDISEVMGFRDEDNITTDILEPGSIAYIRIASFMNNIALDSETLFPFYEQIRDYDHLIIDIRGNSGGWSTSFPLNVLSKLIDEEISFKYAEFFIDSELTADFFEMPMGLAGGMLYGIFPARQFVRDQDMPYFNPDDLDMLDYAIVWEVRLIPREDNIPFGGKIWLLVDGGSASASEMAAQISISTGFATVVGQPTAGISGVIYTYAALPQTGMLFRIDLGYTVDQYGRSFEEFGVIPHVLNAGGLDALETVLLMIALSEIPVKYVDGEAFVPLRMTAYAHGWAVRWDDENWAVHGSNDAGETWTVIVYDAGGFIAEGKSWIPHELAEQLFG